MFDNYFLNGQSYGDIASTFQENNYDPGLFRPYFDDKGRRMVTVRNGFRVDKETKKLVPKYEGRLIKDLMGEGIISPVFNATSLRREEWLQFDRIALKAMRSRLRLWEDIASRNLFSGFDGMSKMILEHETMSDPGRAFMDMDVLSEGSDDTPYWQLEGLPLPITHAGFWMSRRRLAISRNSGTPIDSTMLEAAARRIGEMIEKVAIGVYTGPSYGGASTQQGGYGRTSTVYGLKNFTDRITKTDLTTPTGSNPEATVNDVLSMRDSLYDANFYGPFMIYHSTDWDRFLDNDYARLGGNNATMTLRDRLRKIEGIADVRRLDFLTSTDDPFTLFMVQMTGDVIRAVVGMPLRVIQWESMGGLRLNFKLMTIMVPQLRADYNGNCGILQATTS